jgi:hypothetical protein
MKYVTCTVGETKLKLLYNVAAMFNLQELYIDAPPVKYIDEDGDVCERFATLLDVITPTTPDSVEKLFKTAAMLAEQGELYCRYMGYAFDEIITHDQLYKLVPPTSFVEFKEAVLSSLVLGMKREVQEKEIDVAMEEIQRQKGERPKIAEYLLIGSVTGMSAKEIMLECPGVLNDMITIRDQSYKGNKKQEGESDL